MSEITELRQCWQHIKSSAQSGRLIDTGVSDYLLLSNIVLVTLEKWAEGKISTHSYQRLAQLLSSEEFSCFSRGLIDLSSNPVPAELDLATSGLNALQHRLVVEFKEQ
jgi:hypothetical protein